MDPQDCEYFCDACNDDESDVTTHQEACDAAKKDAWDPAPAPMSSPASSGADTKTTAESDGDTDDMLSCISTASDFGTGTPLEISRLLGEMKARCIKNPVWDGSLGKAVVHDLTKHKNNARVCMYGGWIVVHLASSAANKLRLGNELGACEAVMGALATHATQPWVTLHLLRAVCALAPNHTKRLLGLGVVEAVVRALKSHAHNAHVCETACHAVAVLAATDATVTAFVEEGACARVVNALAVHATTSPATCKRACEALDRLAEDVAAGPREESLAACAAIAAALRGNSTDSEAVKACCMTVASLAACSKGIENALKASDTGVVEVLQGIADGSRGPQPPSEGIKTKAKKALKVLSVCVNI